MIREFGVSAIMRRSYLGAGELLRMRTAERILRAYEERNRSINWVEWARENPEDSQLLITAMRASEAIHGG